MIESEKLLPCPFCGGKARRGDADAGMNGTPGWYVYAKCTVCAVKTRDEFVSSEAQAQEAVVFLWNARSPAVKPDKGQGSQTPMKQGDHQ